jgi:hypothetical protein
MIFSKKILNTWFDSYIDMYNLVIKKFRNEFKAGLLNNPKFKLTDLNTELNISKLIYIFYEIIISKNFKGY